MGAGTELAQLRPYEVGDDVRQIDAAATARTGEPHVRLHVPERTLTTWIVLDVSPSMAFGTAQRLKADVAEGVALVLGNLAVRRAGRVAMMTFGAGAPAPAAPARIAARASWRCAACSPRASRPTASTSPHALAHALGRVGKVARQPGFVAVISDFREHARLDARARRPRRPPLGAGRRDRRPARGRAARRRAPGRRRSRDRRARSRSTPRARACASASPRSSASAARRVARELRRLHVEHVALSTDRDWLLDLGRRLR